MNKPKVSDAEMIKAWMATHGGVQRTAKMLGYSRFGVYLRWRKLGLPAKRTAERTRRDLELAQTVRRLTDAR